MHDLAAIAHDAAREHFQDPKRSWRGAKIVVCSWGASTDVLYRDSIRGIVKQHAIMSASLTPENTASEDILAQVLLASVKRHRAHDCSPGLFP